MQIEKAVINDGLRVSKALINDGLRAFTCEFCYFLKK